MPLVEILIGTLGAPLAKLLLKARPCIESREEPGELEGKPREASPGDPIGVRA